MKKATQFTPPNPEATTKDVLTEVLREGAQRMLVAALKEEVAIYVEKHRDLRDDAGHRLVVRNGKCPERSIQTGIGAMEIERPRINDRRTDANGQRLRFTSNILPPYLRRSKSMDELIPWLYLKGISIGDFSEALASLVGHDAPGLSATTVVRLKSVWELEYQDWNQRSFAGKRYV